MGVGVGVSGEVGVGVGGGVRLFKIAGNRSASEVSLKDMAKIVRHSTTTIMHRYA